MPRGTPIQYSLLSNTAKVCAMNGCEKPRFKLAKHCRKPDERRCVAVTLFLTELPESEQELEPFVRNLGHHCLRPVVPALGKGERQRQYSQALGNYLYSQLSKLLVHIMAHKRNHDLAKKQFDEAAKQPFVGA